MVAVVVRRLRWRSQAERWSRRRRSRRRRRADGIENVAQPPAWASILAGADPGVASIAAVAAAVLIKMRRPLQHRRIPVHDNDSFTTWLL
jgi:hypothetical protein